MQIEFYLLYLRETALQGGDVRGRFHVFNTFLFTVLSDRRQYLSVQAAYQQTVRRWTKGVDLFSQDFILVPINDAERHHWSLAIICYPRKQVDVARYAAASARKTAVARPSSRRPTKRRRPTGASQLPSQMRIASNGVGLSPPLLPRLPTPSSSSSSSSPSPSHSSAAVPRHLRGASSAKAATPVSVSAPVSSLAGLPSPSSPPLGLRHAPRMLRSTSSSASLPPLPPSGVHQ